MQPTSHIAAFYYEVYKTAHQHKRSGFWRRMQKYLSLANEGGIDQQIVNEIVIGLHTT